MVYSFNALHDQHSKLKLKSGESNTVETECIMSLRYTPFENAFISCLLPENQWPEVLKADILKTHLACLERGVINADKAATKIKLLVWIVVTRLTIIPAKASVLEPALMVWVQTALIRTGYIG